MAAQEVHVLVVAQGRRGGRGCGTAPVRRHGARAGAKAADLLASAGDRGQHSTTELLRSGGLEEEIRAGGLPDVEWLGLVGETLADADRGEVVSLGLPTKEQAGVLSPTAPLCAPQDHTEAVRLGYARSLGAEVEFGREVLRVDVADDGAEALVRNGDRIRGVSARYVIGADGAHSAVRSALDIEMGGPGAVDTLSVSAAFTAPLWDLVGEPRYGLYPSSTPRYRASSSRRAAATTGSSGSAPT